MRAAAPAGDACQLRRPRGAWPRIATSWAARSICCRRSSSRSSITIATSWCCASTIPTRGAWPGGTTGRTTSSISACPISARIRSRRCPRDYGAAVEKFGIATLKRIGMLPWREAEEFGNLRRAFEGFRRDDHLRAERHRAVRRGRQPLHAGRAHAAARQQQLRRAADGADRRARAVRDRRCSSGIRSRLTHPRRRDRRRSPTRATRRSTRCSRAISWWTALLQADKDAATGRDRTTTSTSTGSSSNARPILEQQIAGSISAPRRRSSPARGKRRDGRRCGRPSRRPRNGYVRIRFSNPQILTSSNSLKPNSSLVACLALFVTSPAAAQQPLASPPPASPQFLSRYDFHLSAAALAHDDQRYSWDTHFGGEIDVVDYVVGRTTTILDYQAVLGNEFRAVRSLSGELHPRDGDVLSTQAHRSRGVLPSRLAPSERPPEGDSGRLEHSRRSRAAPARRSRTCRSISWRDWAGPRSA